MTLPVVWDLGGTSQLHLSSVACVTDEHTSLVNLEACLDWRNKLLNSRIGLPQRQRPHCKNHPGLLNRTTACLAGILPPERQIRALTRALKQAPGEPLSTTSF